MNFQTYHFELKDILTQFVNAFDDVVINRYTKERVVADRIAVRYVYAPKQRVLHDLINKAQHITLPVAAVVISSIRRDPTRVFNKLKGAHYALSDPTKAGQMLQPVPVNITVNLSILTKFQADMDQIMTNFAPYCDPYIVISWRRADMPDQEIRSKVIWSGDLAVNYPVDINASQPARVACDTSFVIEGWLFKNDATPSGYIFNIDANFTAVKKLESLETMAAARTEYNTDAREIIGRPQMTFVTPPVGSLSGENVFDVYGSMLGYTNSVYVSATDVFSAQLSAFDPFATTSLSAEYPAIDAIPVDYVIDSDNKLTITLPAVVNPGRVEVIVVNPAGYGLLTQDTTSSTSTYQYPFSSGIEVG